MTEDVPDVTSADLYSDTKTMTEQSVGNPFRVPVSLKSSEKQVKPKNSSVKNKDAPHSEVKKKKKKIKLKSPKQNQGETEDATESVDSGCIADIAADVTDWPQVTAAVLEERNYCLSLLSWLPDFQWVLPDPKPPQPAPRDEEDALEDEEEQTGKNTKAKKKVDPLGTTGKLRKFLNETDEIDSLREKYSEMLEQLKKGRRNKVSRKKEGKLQRKLKNLNKRNKKNTNRQRKLEQAEIFQAKHKALEVKNKKVPQHKKIFNEKGKLVFSKFDFSSDGSGLHSNKAKNLESKVAQAIKEREIRKRLQKDGDLKAAAEIKEITAWSSALQRADGVKVRDDLDMLQKSLKKKEYRKKMSKKRWEERTVALEKKMQDRQTKRQDNLKARREAKLQKKGKKMKQKGHIVPGF